jgi:hypothetical protein
MNLKIKIITISFFVILIGTILTAFIIKSRQADEIEIITNENNGENIYLLCSYWGNDERMAIGLNKELRKGFLYSYPEKYNLDWASPFFYKLENDTLFIYGLKFIKPEITKFKTIFKQIELTKQDYDSLCNNKIYLKLGLNIFPKSLSYTHYPSTK